MVRKDIDEEHGYHGHWDVHICSTCYKVPSYWFLGCFCMPCFAYYQREIVIEGWDNYLCCQNYLCGCGQCCKKITDPCPCFCGCLEAFCFPWCTLATNRAVIQDKFMISNTKLEEMMALALCVCHWTILILSYILPIPRDVRCLLDCVDMCCAGCYLSQQQHEWDFRMKGVPSLSNQMMSEDDNTLVVASPQTEEYTKLKDDGVEVEEYKLGE